MYQRTVSCILYKELEPAATLRWLNFSFTAEAFPLGPAKPPNNHSCLDRGGPTHFSLQGTAKLCMKWVHPEHFLELQVCILNQDFWCSISAQCESIKNIEEDGEPPVHIPSFHSVSYWLCILCRPAFSLSGCNARYARAFITFKKEVLYLFVG